MRAPATRVVDAEVRLRHLGARRARIESTPDEDALEPSLAVVRDERAARRGHLDAFARSVPRNELRRAGQARQRRECHRDCERDDNRAEEQAAGRRNGSGAVTASDPDVERFLLTLQARRSPRTVDAYP